MGVITIFIIFVSGAAAVWAQGPPNETRTSISLTPLYQVETALTDRTDFSVQHNFFNLNIYSPVNRTFAWGLSGGYHYQRYDFSGLPIFGLREPWEQIHTVNLGLPLFYNPSQKWRLMLSPSVQYSGEPDADFHEAVSYSGVLTATHVYSPDLMLGVGVALFDQLEKTSFFPFIAVRWLITPEWRLANPFRGGPVGPAGLELAYLPDNQWELAAGGAYRTFRFRLDEDGLMPNGVGESQFFTAFGRISKKMGSRFKLDLYGGAFLEGDLILENANGSEIGSEDYDATPFVGLTVNASF